MKQNSSILFQVPIGTLAFGGSYRLAHPFPELAMKIVDERKPKRIGPRNWHKFFKDAGIGQSSAERRLLTLVNRIQQETKAVIGENNAGADRVSPIVLAHCGHFLAQKWGEH